MQHEPAHEFPTQQEVEEFYNATSLWTQDSLVLWRDLLVRASSYWLGIVIEAWNAITCPYRTSYQHCDGNIWIGEDQVPFHYEVALSVGILLSTIATLRAFLLIVRSKTGDFDVISAVHLGLQSFLLMIRTKPLIFFGGTEQYSNLWLAALAEEVIHINFAYACSRFTGFQNYWDFTLGVSLCCAIMTSPDFVINYACFRAILPIYFGMAYYELFVNLINKRSEQ